MVFRAHLAYVLHEVAGRTVEDGHLGTVQLHEAVVDAGCIEGSHGMFDGADTHVAVCHHRAAGCVHHIFGQGFDDGTLRQINAL